MRGSAALRAVVAPGGVLAGPWVRNELWRRARAVPSLDLRFAENKSLVDSVSGQNLITFTRASTGTFVDSDGVIRSAGNDVPRFEHHPTTGECLGLLVEEQRVNSIRNNTMVGAVAGTPGTLPTNWGESLAGLTRQVVATGTINGVSYIDIRLSGTTNTTSLAFNFESSTQVAAATGQSWSLSTWLAIAGGSTTNITTLYANYVERTSAGGSVTQQNGVNLVGSVNSTFSRYSSSVTLTGGATTAFVQPRLLLGFASGVAIDITLRIGLPQLEQGAFVTSVIPTTGTAATRTADVVSITTAGGNIRTLFTSFRSPASGTRPVVSLDDNTANERIEILTSGTDPKLLVTDGGSAVADLDAGTVTANTLASIAARFNTDDYAISINGGTSQLDAAGTLPTVNRIRIGSNQAGGYLNGPIARIATWDTSLPLLPSISQ